MMSALDFEFRDALLLLLFAWCLFRYPWITVALLLFVGGLVTVLIIPADLYNSLPSLAMMGGGLGMMLHHYQQRQGMLEQQARTPRTYKQAEVPANDKPE